MFRTGYLFDILDGGEFTHLLKKATLFHDISISYKDISLHTGVLTYFGILVLRGWQSAPHYDWHCHWWPALTHTHCLVAHAVLYMPRTSWWPQMSTVDAVCQPSSDTPVMSAPRWSQDIAFAVVMRLGSANRSRLWVWHRLTYVDATAVNCSKTQIKQLYMIFL